MTAFLLRQNDLWNASTDLNASNAVDVKIPRAAFLTPVVTPQPAGEPEADNGAMIWGIAAVVAVLLILFIFILKKSRNTTTI